MARGKGGKRSEFIGGGAPLDVTVVRREGRATVTATGDVDRETSSKLAEAIAAAGETSDAIELDLDGVRFMDSQGLRVMIEASNAAGPDKSVVVAAASPQVRQLLATTGLTEMFALEDEGSRREGPSSR